MCSSEIVGSGVGNSGQTRTATRSTSSTATRTATASMATKAQSASRTLVPLYTLPCVFVTSHTRPLACPPSRIPPPPPPHPPSRTPLLRPAISLAHPSSYIPSHLRSPPPAPLPHRTASTLQYFVGHEPVIALAGEVMGKPRSKGTWWGAYGEGPMEEEGVNAIAQSGWEGTSTALLHLV
jgi:hypothetical protein